MDKGLAFMKESSNNEKPFGSDFSVGSINEVDKEIIDDLEKRGYTGLYSLDDLIKLGIVNSKIIKKYIVGYYNFFKGNNSIIYSLDGDNIIIEKFEDFCILFGIELNGKDIVNDLNNYGKSLDSIYEIYAIIKASFNYLNLNNVIIKCKSKSKGGIRFDSLEFSNNKGTILIISIHFNIESNGYSHIIDGYDKVNKIIFEAKNYYSTNILLNFSKFIRDISFYGNLVSAVYGILLFRHKTLLSGYNNSLKEGEINIKIYQLN